MKILNFGSLNIDYVYSVDSIVREGETIATKNRNVYAGGKGLNQSIALSRAGSKVYHAGSVNKNDGIFLVDILSKENVNIEFIEFEESESTGHAIISVDKKGQNSIMLYGGTNQMITKSHINKTLELFNSGDFLLLQNEISNIDYIIELAHKKKMVIILNPSPMNEKIYSYDLDKVNYLILNVVEGMDMTEKVDHNDILISLSEKYPNMNVILTIGKDGSLYKRASSDKVIVQNAYIVDVIDSTAAGDTFTGYLFALISQGYEVEESLDIASMASAISVTRNGAESSIPRIEEVMKFKIAK